MTRAFQTRPEQTVQSSPNAVDATSRAASAGIVEAEGSPPLGRKRAAAYQTRQASMPTPAMASPSTGPVSTAESTRDGAVSSAAHSTPNAPAKIVAASMRLPAAARTASSGGAVR